jgi:predicted secreted protein
MRISPHEPVRALAAALAAVTMTAAHAQTLAPPENVVSLTASASAEISKDWLTVVFSTTREGSEATAVQGQIRLALDTALTEARKVARPGQVEVQTGAFSLYPRYAPAGVKGDGSPGGIAGWQGSAELIVEGRDASAIAQLTGRIHTLSIARVGYTLSREARERLEGELTERAIARFRSRASDVARQFGLAGYAVREVVLSASEPQAGMVPMLRMQSARAPADEALPVEAGKAVVSATVSGSVQMK